MSLRVGVDVGGTYTDAVVLDDRQLLASAKRPTSNDVTHGIVEALTAAIADSGVSRRDVQRVMIGTTHFTNAVIQRRGLLRTGVVRLGYPATQMLPPFVDWPVDVRDAVDGTGVILPGGVEFDGREIARLDAAQIRDAARDLRRAGTEAIAVSSVFSPIADAHEREAAAIIRAEFPEIPVVCSADIGRIGLLERENAAALNAALLALAATTTDAFARTLEELAIHAELYLTQNDGTLMRVAEARQFPIRTFASGPTNSIRGAYYLSDVADGIVVDIGGTTMDVGALQRGFPREAGFAVAVGGVRTNFRMPDVTSVGLGGGSIVSDDGGTVGPVSVGSRLLTEARSFGGGTLTATDIANAVGRARVGGDPRVAPDVARRAAAAMDRLFAGAIDRMKETAADVPVVLVGGGAILIGDDPVAGVARVVRPAHGDVANAIGAALAQVGGEVDQVVSLETTLRERAIMEATMRAQEIAVRAGAVPVSLQTIAVDEIPIAYLPSNAVRLHVKVVGDLP